MFIQKCLGLPARADEETASNEGIIIVSLSLIRYLWVYRSIHMYHDASPHSPTRMRTNGAKDFLVQGSHHYRQARTMQGPALRLDLTAVFPHHNDVNQYPTCTTTSSILRTMTFIPLRTETSSCGYESCLHQAIVVLVLKRA